MIKNNEPTRQHEEQCVEQQQQQQKLTQFVRVITLTLRKIMDHPNYIFITFVYTKSFLIKFCFAEKKNSQCEISTLFMVFLFWHNMLTQKNLHRNYITKQN